uniref:Uncharacterized protein n=1 Tax=Eutreptiella gymnastica TaxID=73025 RepID=A0A7S4GBZ0_9EUGL
MAVSRSPKCGGLHNSFRIGVPKAAGGNWAFYMMQKRDQHVPIAQNSGGSVPLPRPFCQNLPQCACSEPTYLHKPHNLWNSSNRSTPEPLCTKNPRDLYSKPCHADY